MNKIGSCKILKKFEENSYEIEFTDGVGISPIFNIENMYPYRGDEAGEAKNQKEVKWVKHMHVAENPQMEKIIDQRVRKKTLRKTYLEYLIKWKGHPIEDASWESEASIQNHRQMMQKLMNRSS
jgi:hypothetical protein